jgi:bifunctional oligoribonuclease and PAP phosphatase NrnA
MNDALIEQARRELLTASRILIVSHIRPDGDAVGSMLGLGLALQETGKTVQMVLGDGVPSSERHLTGSDQVRHKPEGEFDLIIVVDCSDLDRVGETLNGYGKPDWNIDHHITNLNFGRLNLIQADAASTAEMLAELIPAWDLPLPAGVVSALLTGILTDTIGFRTSNVSPKTLRIAADLMEAGGNIHGLYYHALLQRSYQAARYWGQGLSKLKREGRMVWTTLTASDRRSAEYCGRDDADLINVVSAIDDTDVSLIFVEQNRSHVKVSWRSQPGFDVSQIALRFGGGGHKAAAGADVEGTLEEVQEKVLTATRSLWGTA